MIPRPKEREQSIQSKIVQTLWLALHVRSIRRNSGKVQAMRDGKPAGWLELSEPGTPDLELFLPSGRRSWLECKRPGEKPTQAQTKWHEQERKLGGRVEVVTGVGEAVAIVRQWMADDRAEAERGERRTG